MSIPVSLSIFTFIISAFFAVVITLGNSTVVLLVIIDPLKKIKTPFSYFLVNLAVSDLIVGTITMPLSIYIHWNEYQQNRSKIYLQKYLHMSYFISSTASILSLVVLCIDRYIAIAWPIKYRNSKENNSKFIYATLFIWFIALSFPFLYFKTGYVIYSLYWTSVSLCIGVVIFVIVYVKFKIYFQNVPGQGSQHNENNIEIKRRAKEKKQSNVFFTIIVMFVVTYIPASIFVYIIKYWKQLDKETAEILRDLSFLFINSNSCMNPFICTLQLTVFRKSLKTIFKKRPGDPDSSRELSIR